MTIIRLDHIVRTLFVRSQLSHTQHSLLKPISMPLAFLVGLLLFSLGACSAATSSTTVPSQTTVPSARQSSPTPTPLPAGIVLYQANWSHGLAGSPGTHGWKVVQGQLESDTSGSATFTIPYRLSVSDYAVEVRIQMVRSVPPYGGNYEIVLPKLPGKDGY